MPRCLDVAPRAVRPLGGLEGDQVPLRQTFSLVFTRSHCLLERYGHLYFDPEESKPPPLLHTSINKGLFQDVGDSHQWG
jgi:hypothetical protein